MATHKFQVGQKVQLVVGAGVGFSTPETLRSFSIFQKGMGSASIRLSHLMDPT